MENQEVMGNHENAEVETKKASEEAAKPGTKKEQMGEVPNLASEKKKVDQEDKISVEVNQKDEAPVNIDTGKKTDWKEKYYYVAAEMENAKKRYERERSNILKFGNEDLLKNLLEVVDNFERTLEALDVEANKDDEKIKNIVVGLEMIMKQFIQTLGKFGLKEVSSLGKIFDPNFHEAMAEQDAPGKKEQEIINEYQKGYILNGRLLRAAKVIVAKGTQKES